MYGSAMTRAGSGMWRITVAVTVKNNREHTTCVVKMTAYGKVYAETENGEYLLRLRLYELEERLDKKG